MRRQWLPSSLASAILESTHCQRPAPVCGRLPSPRLHHAGYLQHRLIKNLESLLVAFKPLLLTFMALPLAVLVYRLPAALPDQEPGEPEGGLRLHRARRLRLLHRPGQPDAARAVAAACCCPCCGHHNNPLRMASAWPLGKHRRLPGLRQLAACCHAADSVGPSLLAQCTHAPINPCAPQTLTLPCSFTTARTASTPCRQAASRPSPSSSTTRHR